MAPVQDSTIPMIFGLSRNDLIKQLKIRPGQIISERQILSQLNFEVEEILNVYGTGRMGNNQILSLNISAYPVSGDIQFLVSFLYKPLAEKPVA